MLIALLAYVLIMVLVGVHSFRQVSAKKEHSFREFAVAGGRQGTAWITLSLMATMVGSSATFGSMGLSAKTGFPSFWWLGVGTIGLLLQAVFLSERVRKLGAHTLPHVAGLVMGRPASLLTALFICISWIGILAAQFTALAQLVGAVPGVPESRFLLPIMGCLIIFYTAAGGQLSVIRTDAAQFLCIALGVGLACAFLYNAENATPELWLSRMEFFNDRFGAAEWFSLMCIVGGAYFVGPDIFSRNLSAKDGKTARRATFFAAGFLLLFSLGMAFLGAWVKANGVGVSGVNPLATLMSSYLPGWLAGLLCLGLISALVSSADTFLISSACIIENDLLQRSSLGRARVFVVLSGVTALILAMTRPDIIGLFMVAYSLYVPGVVIPLATGILCHGRRSLNLPLLYTGMIGGGLCGLTGSLAGISYLPLVGMGLSLVCSLGAVALGTVATSHTATPATTHKI